MLDLMVGVIFNVNIYRPQTKFAKVMFSQVSVCPQGRSLSGRGVFVHGGLCPGVLCPGFSVWAGSLCPWGSLSRAVSVIYQGDATRMVTCGRTYPTGMHSCFKGISQWRIQDIQWSDLEGDARKVFSRNLHGQNCSGIGE